MSDTVPVDSCVHVPVSESGDGVSVTESATDVVRGPCDGDIVDVACDTAAESLGVGVAVDDLR